MVFIFRPKRWVIRALEVPHSCLKRFKCQGKDKGGNKERPRQKMKGTYRQKEKNESQRGFFVTKWHILCKWARETTQTETWVKAESKVSVSNNSCITFIFSVSNDIFYTVYIFRRRLSFKKKQHLKEHIIVFITKKGSEVPLTNSSGPKQVMGSRRSIMETKGQLT